MKKWNRLDNFIFSIETVLNRGRDAYRDNSSDIIPDEDTFDNAQAAYYKEEYEKLKGFHIPQPLIQNADGYMCPRCKRGLTISIDEGHCPYCGQRYFVNRMSNGARQYIENTNNTAQE